MIPGLGDKYEIEIETIAKPKDDYMTDAYFELDLPVAPAVMVGDEIIVEGTDVSDEKLEEVVCRHLGLPKPVPHKKGFFGRIGRTS
jgi:predicted HAD superfamily phosphohydrolase YqeG